MNTHPKINSLSHQTKSIGDLMGNMCVAIFHYLALFTIGGVIVWSAITSFLGMVDVGHSTIEDILLLFIYLELGAIVGIYFKTNHMPVRFLIYVSVTALTRMMLGDIQAHHQEPGIGILYIAGAILILALATLAFRFGSHHYPSAAKQNLSDM